MKIQLSPKRIIPEVMTVWSEAGPEVDIVMDLTNLTFRPGSITQIYAFHVCDHLFPEQSQAALENWAKLLPSQGRIHTLNDNFEYVARAFIGGEIGIALYNNIHNHPHQITRDSMIVAFKRAGFRDDDIVVWLDGNPEGMLKQHYELILTATKK